MRVPVPVVLPAGNHTDLRPQEIKKLLRRRVFRSVVRNFPFFVTYPHISAEPAYAESEYCIDVDGDYYEIEKMINSEKYDEAEKILSEVLSSDRKGEWYYCSALLSYHRGWLEEAYNYIETACNMDRNNEKYIRLYNTITESRSGTVFAKRGSSGRLCSADNCENCADLCECCCDIGDCFSGF